MISRIFQGWLAVLFLGLRLANAGSSEHHLSPLASESFRRDARLWDVCMVDAEFGWAVGDRGAIWHTRDGGQTWHLQRSGVEVPLRAVAFANREFGIAVGGQTDPYTHSSSAVVLLTRDGGRQWLPSRSSLLPGLRRVGLFDTRNGWAAGDPSAMYPSGVFVTADSGQSWRPLTGPGTASWLAADLLDPQTGALAGRKGTAAAVRRGEVRPGEVGRFGLRNLAQLRLLPPTGGWLAADGGLLLHTPDLGLSWQTPPTELPEAAAHFDFHALAAHGEHVWTAGTPGTRVFHSADGGRTWQISPTGSFAPIRGMAFADERRGVAVGDLGTILATSDGGQTWQTQQAGGKRAALMAVFVRGEDVPLELLARLCGDEGYLGVIEIVGRDDVEVAPRSPTHVADRTHEAVVAVGACGADFAWRFPMRQKGLGLDARQITAIWDRANDGRAFEELGRHLVRQIRLWRPDVMITHDASPQGDSPHAHLVNQLVLDAIEQAADPTRFAALAADAGLPPWRARKVFAKLESGQRGMPELTTSQIAVRLGTSLEGLCALPRGVLHEVFTPPPATLGFSLLVSRLPQDPGGRDFFEGIVLSPGGDARRELLQPAPGGIDALRRIAQRRQHIEGILRRAKDDVQTSAHLLAGAGELTRGLEPSTAGDVLYHLAQRFVQSGHWVMAAEMFELLVEDHPDHPLCLPALTWLVQYHASSEALWRIQGEQRVNVQFADGRPVAQEPKLGVRHASALAVEAAEVTEGPKRAAELGARIEQTRPALFAQPSLRFPLAAADRNRGLPKAAERYFLLAGRAANRDAWWLNARSELWLAEPDGLPPKPTLRSARASAKPRLDGKLDDSAWQRAKPAPLVSLLGDDDAWPAEARVAYDDQFLYWAVQCRKAPGVEYPPPQGPRPRNADLSARDRIELYIDLDRDYATWYRFAVDHRGWVAESCWGDASWNPTWFVAQAEDEETWTIEAAIPLDQLTGSYPTSRDVWAVGVQRTVPGAGFQSWTQPAAIEVMPEGFGWLMFD
ncbi:MAG: YCF48-related protein [Thermoguttaceae bacterium]|nr:YCF48-related protein [Thermoguttaceae bacterium]